MPLPVTPLKQKQLEKRMAELGLLEEDIEEKFVRGSGSGGQKINKTSSCVYLMHNPSGLEVKCQKERSQAMNRFFARRELCEKMAEQIEGEKSKKQQAREKIRRQNVAGLAVKKTGCWMIKVSSQTRKCVAEKWIWRIKDEEA